MNIQKQRMDRMYGAVTRINAIYENYAKQNGMSYLEWQMFYALQSAKEEEICLTQKMLCDKLKASKSTVNSIVRKYLSEGLIELKDKTDNKKEKLVVLTEQGKECTNRIVLPVMNAEMGVMAQISDEQLDVLIHAESVFAEGLEELLFQKKE